MGARTTTREMWQSADHPDSERQAVEGTHDFETSGNALYDPATDTIYDPPAAPPPTAADVAKAEHAGKTVKSADAAGRSKPGNGSLPAGDPVVDKVRMLLQEDRMEVRGREVHNGVDVWAISLKADVGRPVWTLWISAADGKPLELRDPGRDSSEQPQVIRWPTYEVLPGGSDASRLLTLAGAHPSAHVVRDGAQIEAAERRLMPPKP
jgi:hypothetical protein